MVFIWFLLHSDDHLTGKVRINKTNIFPDWEEFAFVQMDRSHMVLVFPGKVEQPWRELSEINDQSEDTWKQVKDAQIDPQHIWPAVSGQLCPSPVYRSPLALSGAREEWEEGKEEKLLRERQGGAVDRSTPTSVSPPQCCVHVNDWWLSFGVFVQREDCKLFSIKILRQKWGEKNL